MDFSRSSSMTRRRFLTDSGKAALAVGLGSTLLEACGGSGSSSSSGPVTLTYGWWSNGPTKDNAMLAWLKAFEKANPNIKIKPEILPWANYWDKVKTTSAGGNAYDIIGIATSQIAPYYDQGVFVDLSQFSDYQSSVKNLQQATVQLNNWGGKQYGLPIGIYLPLLGYNKDLLKAANVPFPDPAKPMTFDEFKAMAKKLTKTQGGKIVQYGVQPNSFMEFDTFVMMEGGQVYDKQVNPTKMLINSPAGVKGLADYLSLFTENISPPYEQLANGPWGPGDLPSLQTGKIAFARIGAYDFADIIQGKLNIGVAPVFSINGKQTLLGNSNSLGIYQGSKHQNEAWTFLKWATQTPAEISFAKISDVPADKTAFAQMGDYVTPKEFVPTLLADFNAFNPLMMTPKEQLQTMELDVITDLTHGKITPAQAAAQMQTQGNTILAS